MWHRQHDPSSYPPPPPLSLTLTGFFNARVRGAESLPPFLPGAAACFFLPFLPCLNPPPVVEAELGLTNDCMMTTLSPSPPSAYQVGGMVHTLVLASPKVRIRLLRVMVDSVLPRINDVVILFWGHNTFAAAPGRRHSRITGFRTR